MAVPPPPGKKIIDTYIAVKCERSLISIVPLNSIKCYNNDVYMSNGGI